MKLYSAFLFLLALSTLCLSSSTVHAASKAVLVQQGPPALLNSSLFWYAKNDKTVTYISYASPELARLAFSLEAFLESSGVPVMAVSLQDSSQTAIGRSAVFVNPAENDNSQSAHVVGRFLATFLKAKKSSVPVYEGGLTYRSTGSDKNAVLIFLSSGLK